nr:RNA binding protein 28 [Hymenolepis microstoma]
MEQAVVLADPIHESMKSKSSVKSRRAMRSTKTAQQKEEMKQKDGEFFISKRPAEPFKLESSSKELSDEVNSGQHDAELPRKGQFSDTSEGRTLFIRNVPFDADEQSLHKFLSTFGELEFVKVVKDKMTNHSRGTAFAKFVLKEDANNILIKFSKSFGGLEFVFGGRNLDLSLAVSKEEVVKLQMTRRGEDASTTSELAGRNLHLARIGLIKPGSKAAEMLTAQEMSMREAIARSKQSKLRDPNIFISPLRLCLRNIPLSIDDRQLRAACQRVIGKEARITECRVMRDLKSGAVNPKSLGFAFVAFEEHKDALKTLQVINNNEKILGGSRKPIVEFSLENSRALEKRRRRQEKSIMIQESKLLGEKSQPGQIRAFTMENKTGKRANKKLKKKGQKGPKRPMRVMPKKLGFKTRTKQKSGRKSSKSRV